MEDKYILEALAKISAKGNETAFRRLTEAMEADINHLVNTYAAINEMKGNFKDDYRQCALKALWDATKTFENEKSSFRTYACTYMKNAIRNYLKTEQSLIRITSGMAENISKIKNAEKRLASAGYKHVSKELLKEESGIRSDRTFRTAMDARMLQELSSLDRPIRNGESEKDTISLGERIYDHSYSVEETVERKDLLVALRKAIKNLSKIDQKIVILSYGLYGCKECSNQTIADYVGLSVTSVCAHRKKALSELQQLRDYYAA